MGENDTCESDERKPFILWHTRGQYRYPVRVVMLRCRCDDGGVKRSGDISGPYGSVESAELIVRLGHAERGRRVMVRGGYQGKQRIPNKARDFRRALEAIIEAHDMTRGPILPGALWRAIQEAEELLRRLDKEDVT